jgi:hypothetical protein
MKVKSNQECGILDIELGCCIFLCSLGCIKLRIAASTNTLKNIELKSTVYFYVSTLLKRIQGPCSYPNFRAEVRSKITDPVSTYSYSLCVSFCSLVGNHMGKEVEAAIKSAWAPRG